jgi:adenylate kinase
MGPPGERPSVHICIVGNTGSGKTTVARILETSLNLPRISSGDIARYLADFDPSTRLALDAGAMAPEKAMQLQIKQRIEAADIQSGGWILEGFPRIPEQLICLMQWTSALPVFVYLDVPIWVAIERLTARGRPDDNPHSIAEKLKSFDESTHPMLDILESGGVLHTINADGRTPEAIATEIEGFCQ